MPDFPIVDTHVHLYDWVSIRYPWMAGLTTLEAPHRPAEFTTAIGGVVVDKIVFVEVAPAPGQNMDEVRWVAEAAKSDPRIQGMVGTVALEDGAKAAEPEIAAFAKMPLARDIRRLIQGHVDEPGWCLRPAFLDGVKLVGKYGLGFEIGIKHPQMKDAIELVRRFPDMRFSLDHIGKPGIKAGLREPWWTDIRTLAGFPNVVCKISGVVTEADHATWTYDEVAPYIARAIEVFGFDRVMFGGDWPVMELATRYPAWVAMVDRITAGASASDLRKLYRETAIRHYRL
jgi:L-fuconolactonase